MAISTISSPAAITVPGSVLQTVYVANRTSFTTSTTGSWVSTGVIASITPKFSTSKILVIASPNAMVDKVTGPDNLGWLIMDRNGTKLGASYTELRTYDRGNSGIQYVSKPSMCFVDEPATTSALTYTIYGEIDTSVTTLSVNIQETRSPVVDGSQYSTSTIILMEIAG